MPCKVPCKVPCRSVCVVVEFVLYLIHETNSESHGQGWWAVLGCKETDELLALKRLSIRRHSSSNGATHRNTLLHMATHVNTLQHSLQHIMPHTFFNPPPFKQRSVCVCVSGREKSRARAFDREGQKGLLRMSALLRHLRHHYDMTEVQEA